MSLRKSVVFATRIHDVIHITDPSYHVLLDCRAFSWSTQRPAATRLSVRVNLH